MVHRGEKKGEMKRKGEIKLERSITLMTRCKEPGMWEGLSPGKLVPARLGCTGETRCPGGPVLVLSSWSTGRDTESV